MLERPDESFYLEQTEQGLALRHQIDKTICLHLDFTSGALAWRLKTAGRKQPLAKAVGFHLKSDLKILDVTAGLGRDVLFLAHLGADVTLLERHPLISSLLADAIYRLGLQSQYTELSKRLHHDCVDSCVFMQECLDKEHCFFDVIYLDPMFPPRRKSALVKKDLQYLHALLGQTIEQADLLLLALQLARQRVVVKRPAWAAPLSDKKPSYCIESKLLRYDVYITNGTEFT